ncbi:MAG TPA: DUF3090 family protein [Acidimicrobiia bacterium]|nr:DUF3090 family protein [Acidimicrobiia bacterium]
MRDLGPAEEFVAGALGEPGERHFYIQVTAAGETVWLHAEKQQVATLSSQCLALLAASDITPDSAAVAKLKDELAVREPEVELFPVGDIQVAVLESELIAIVISAPEGEADDDSIRFLVAPEQVQAMAEVGLEVVAAGRPICPHCHLPEDPLGHRCPATNGHFPA